MPPKVPAEVLKKVYTSLVKLQIKFGVRNKLVPVDFVVFFLIILALVLFLKGCPDTLCGIIAICPFLPDSHNLVLPV